MDVVHFDPFRYIYCLVDIKCSQLKVVSFLSHDFRKSNAFIFAALQDIKWPFPPPPQQEVVFANIFCAWFGLLKFCGSNSTPQILSFCSNIDSKSSLMAHFSSTVFVPERCTIVNHNLFTKRERSPFFCT